MVIAVVIAGIVVIAGTHPADAKTWPHDTWTHIGAGSVIAWPRTNIGAAAIGPDKHLGGVGRACQRDHQTAQQRSCQKDLAHISICPRISAGTTLSDRADDSSSAGATVSWATKRSDGFPGSYQAVECMG